MKAKPFKLIIIYARRWFDRVNGNTYHTVTVTVKHSRKPDVVLRSGYEYGYGEQYMQTAHELLMTAGYFPRTGERYASGADVDYDRFISDKINNREKYYVTVHDVQRKKDLEV